MSLPCPFLPPSSKLSNCIRRLSAQHSKSKSVSHSPGGCCPEDLLCAAQPGPCGKRWDLLPERQVTPSGREDGLHTPGICYWNFLVYSSYARHKNSCLIPISGNNQPQSLKSMPDSPSWLSPLTSIHHSVNKHSESSCCCQAPGQRALSDLSCLLSIPWLLPKLGTSPSLLIPDNSLLADEATLPWGTAD